MKRQNGNSRFSTAMRLVACFVALLALTSALQAVAADGVDPNPAGEIRYWQMKQMELTLPTESALEGFKGETTGEGLQAFNTDETELAYEELAAMLAESPSIVLELSKVGGNATAKHRYSWTVLPSYTDQDSLVLHIASEVIDDAVGNGIVTFADVKVNGERVARVSVNGYDKAPKETDVTINLPSQSKAGKELTLSITVRDSKEALRSTASYHFELREGLMPTPTPEPTEEPTPVPTEEPTAVPTEEPTAVPTEEPTAVPTEEPTAVPTEEPTAVPTEEPTAVPTEEPTAVPTEEPTAVPTEEPTAVPTEEPTAVPTEEPTPVPTEEPTAVPTEEPTAVPTEEPTAEPTADASAMAVMGQMQSQAAEVGATDANTARTGQAEIGTAADATVKDTQISGSGDAAQTAAAEKAETTDVASTVAPATDTATKSAESAAEGAAQPTVAATEAATEALKLTTAAPETDVTAASRLPWWIPALILGGVALLALLLPKRKRDDK